MEPKELQTRETATIADGDSTKLQRTGVSQAKWCPLLLGPPHIVTITGKFPTSFFLFCTIYPLWWTTSSIICKWETYAHSSTSLADTIINLQIPSCPTLSQWLSLSTWSLAKLAFCQQFICINCNHRRNMLQCFWERSLHSKFGQFGGQKQTYPTKKQNGTMSATHKWDIGNHMHRCRWRTRIQDIVKYEQKDDQSIITTFKSSIIPWRKGESDQDWRKVSNTLMVCSLFQKPI